MSGALELTIALPGLQSLTVGLSRYRADIADWSTFWREKFAPFFYRWVLTDFVLEGGGSGATWAPLSPAYAAWKAKHYPGTGLLVRSGALKASLAGPEAPRAIFRPTTTSLTIGTSVPYGLPHQTGTSRMPQRPPLRVNAAFMQVVGKQWMPQRPPLRVNAAFMQVVGKQLQLTIQEAWVRRRAEMGATPAAA